MKVALIRLPKTYANNKNLPLGLGYISSYLKQNGYSCELFDAYINSWTIEKLVENLKEYNPNIIGISAMTHEITTAAKVASAIKAKNIDAKIVIGGCHITALPERTLREFPDFDYGIYGEGEKSILELVKYLEGTSDKTIEQIGSLVYRANDEIVLNKKQEILTAEELDQLPYPDFSDYFENKSLKIDTYTIMASRGCPYNCIFCMQVLGRKVRHRAPENVFAEVKFAIDNYGIKKFDFVDEIFLFDNEKTRKFLNLLIESGLNKKITWYALTRANFVNPDIINLAKKAGCVSLSMGVESGDDEILKNINKNITVDTIKNAAKIIKKAGIFLNTYYILGHPDETFETAQKTIDLAIKLNTDVICVGIMVPYPGTKIYEMALAGQGGYTLLTDDWANYDKYFVNSLEFKNVSYQKLNHLQKFAIIKLYLHNYRILDFIKYIWTRRAPISYMFLKYLKNKLVKRELAI